MARKHWKRTLIDILLRRPPPPDPMTFFGSTLADRQAERREAERLKAARQPQAEPRVERTEPPPKPLRHPVQDVMEPRSTPTARSFDEAAGTSRQLSQQVFNVRFRSDAAREAAIDAMEEAERRRELNDQTLYAALEHIERVIDKWTGPRPMSPEGGRDVNESARKARAAHVHEKETIARDLAMSLYEAERLNPLGAGFKKPGPPLQLTGPAPDSAEPFNKAAAAPTNWNAIFFAAVQNNVSIEVAQAELEPATEVAVGSEGTPPEPVWSPHFNDVSRVRPNPEPEPDLGIDV